VQNDVASVELEGELRVVREYGETVVLGQLSPVRGSFFLAATATAFSVQGGTVTFDDVENLDPALDVSASARVSDFDIDVHIGGRLSEPILSLAGHSGEIVLGEQDVLAILALGDTTGVSVGSRAGSYASSLFLSTIESTARRTLGVEQFEVTYGEFEGDTEERGLSVTLGKYISPRLYVRYTRPLSVTATGDLAAEYRLSRRWTAGADWDEYDLFHLSLRFKWDY
jgi:autotransporter translocation and assembly factor TamB